MSQVRDLKNQDKIAGPGTPIASGSGQRSLFKHSPRGNAEAVPDGKDELFEKSWIQYCLVVLIFLIVCIFDVSLQELVGYQTIPLINLFAVVMLALFFKRGPVILGTTLTSLGWNFLSAPPRFSFHISSFYDKMMIATYFLVAVTIAQLTTRLRAHRESENKARLLAESERLSRVLLNSVSHELRTPLAAITGAASALHSSGPLTPAQEKLAGEIQTASARLNRVVQGLLNAARIQSGTLRPRLDWCDIKDLVKVTLREVGKLTEEHPIESKIAPDLPLVKLDFVLMEQALANLLVNAAFHTPPGTPVQISARVEKDRLFLEVRDRGPGLPPDQLERLFEMFHRAPDARPGGTGVGLAIVKGFVEAQGGRVIAANNPEGGAIFTICMPTDVVPELPAETL